MVLCYQNCSEIFFETKFLIWLTSLFTRNIFNFVPIVKIYINKKLVYKFRKKEFTLESILPHCSIACNTIRSYFMWTNSKPCYSETNRLNIMLTFQFGRCVLCGAHLIQNLFFDMYKSISVLSRRTMGLD